MSEETSPAGSESRHVQVLYFEDTDADALSVRSHMESVPALRVELTPVKRLDAGLALLKERGFDLALLDLNLPDSQGLHSLDRLREAAPSLPVVVIISVMDDAMALEILKRGAQECLTKGPALEARLANSIRFAMCRQQRATEVALRVRQAEASGAHASTIVEATPNAVVVLDRQGTVRFANPAAEAMFAHKGNELLSQQLGLPLADGQTTELEIVQRNGQSGVAELHVVEIDWDEGRAYLATLRDITERKQMEMALVRAEKMQALGTLAGGIAHDFNNILLTVSGNAKLALEDLPPDSPAYDNVLEIAKAGSRATALTRKILSFSRQQEIKREVVQVQPVVEETLALLRATLPPRIEIHGNFPAGLPPISADASQLQQIVMNLATNAADAIGEQGGALEISAALVHLNGNGSSLSSKLPHGDYVRLSFKDTGPGIDKHTLGRVFEPFFTTKAQGRGTGMGLPIVHGIMKNHLGEVTVYSEVGKGAVFNLYFPVAEHAAMQVQPAAPIPQGRGQHILYVDDEEPLVLLITRTLKRLGYEVTGFTDPLQALHALRQHPCSFRALVTDLSMPAMSGTDLAREALEICPQLPVILTSGYIRPQDQEVAQRVGVRELLLKPDTVEELGAVLQRVLGGNECEPESAKGFASDTQIRRSRRAGTS
ncbi:MAG TPA: response regulator [Terriglobales bacterium]|nr:response regulator [Terriglobales bacterium]